MSVDGEDEADALRHPGPPAFPLRLILQQGQLVTEFLLSEQRVKVLLNVADRCLQLGQAEQQVSKLAYHVHRGSDKPGPVVLLWLFVIFVSVPVVIILQGFRVGIQLKLPIEPVTLKESAISVPPEH